MFFSPLFGYVADKTKATTVKENPRNEKKPNLAMNLRVVRSFI